MVKAGVYLILRVGPALTHLEVVTIVLAAVGAATMLVGGWRALRQTDIKLLLAYGTVSQLGFLAAVAGVATHDAVMVALAMLIAHAVFKAPLFMVVGIIDKMFGTRDLRVLSGVGRAAPIIAVIGTVSAASMAAVPPLYGFVAKEAIYTALWSAGGWQRLLLIALIAGSILTVAYSWRFVRGAFGPAPGAPRVATPRISVLYWLPPAAVALFSIVLVVAVGPLEEALRAYSSILPETGTEVHLAVVPHLGIPLLASVLTLALGIGLSLLAQVPSRSLQKKLSPQRWADGRPGRGLRRRARLPADDALDRLHLDRGDHAVPARLPAVHPGHDAGGADRAGDPGGADRSPRCRTTWCSSGTRSS